MKKIGIALTLVLCGLEVTHAQNGGQLKQAQVSTSHQTPQQIADQYLASQKSLTQRKVGQSAEQYSPSFLWQRFLPTDMQFYSHSD